MALAVIMTRFLLIFLIVILQSCFNSKGKLSELEIKFSANLIDHMINREFDFFHKVELYPNYEDTTVSELNHLGAWALHTYKVSKNEIKLIKKEFDLDNRPFLYDSNSNCINCQRDFDCIKAKYATPSFYFLKKKLKIDSNFLPSEFRIYHIDAQQGMFIPQASLILGLCYNNGWSNGYSKGLLLNESDGLVTFWMTAW